MNARACPPFAPSKSTRDDGRLSREGRELRQDCFGGYWQFLHPVSVASGIQRSLRAVSRRSTSQLAGGTGSNPDDVGVLPGTIWTWRPEDDLETRALGSALAVLDHDCQCLDFRFDNNGMTSSPASNGLMFDNPNHSFDHGYSHGLHHLACTQ